MDGWRQEATIQAVSFVLMDGWRTMRIPRFCGNVVLRCFSVGGIPWGYMCRRMIHDSTGLSGGRAQCEKTIPRGMYRSFEIVWPGRKILRAHA